MSPSAEDKTVKTKSAAGKPLPAEAAATNGHPNSHANGHTNGQAHVKPVWQIVLLPVEQIVPNPYQPRVTFEAAEMDELIESVRARGVQQPIIVRSLKSAAPAPAATAKTASNGKPPASKTGMNGQAQQAKSHSNGKSSTSLRYELVAGERRLRACKEAKKRFIPAIVRDDLSDAEAAELALLENVQRSNLTCIEEARGYKRLMLQFRMKEERIAKKVGKSVGTIRELMKLLQLPEGVQMLLWEKKLTAAHGYALLPLAPFERICVLVAERIVRDKLTAASLQANILPNHKDLKAQNLLVELDYKTKFDWREECGKCPFKAYVSSGYQSFCLKPDEWLKKQTAALEQQQQEAAQVMEQARKDNSAVVDVEQLKPGTYKDLSYGEPPAGCTPQCPCRGEAVDALDPTKKRAVCLDPERYKGLVQAEREAQEESRRLHYNALWEAAKAKLLADVENGDLRRTVILLALPILRSLYDEYGYAENWRQGVEQIAEELNVSLLQDFLAAESEAQAYAALDGAMQAGCAPERVLLLCAVLLLAQEAQTAIRYIRETPGLDFVLENKQHLLEPDDETSNALTQGSQNLQPGPASSEDAADEDGKVETNEAGM